MWFFLPVLAIILAYLLGSISSAIVLSKLLHLPDPRTYGSKNPGATNILRLGNKKIAIFTLIGDALKGIIPILIGKWYGFNLYIIALLTFAVFLGHLYPIFFQFKGGKGVATAFGCCLALSWPIGILLVIQWVITILLFGYSSLAAILCALLAPFYTYYFTNYVYAIAISVISVLLILRHRKNIGNLLAGQENKIGKGL